MGVILSILIDRSRSARRGWAGGAGTLANRNYCARGIVACKKDRNIFIYFIYKHKVDN